MSWLDWIFGKKTQIQTPRSLDDLDRLNHKLHEAEASLKQNVPAKSALNLYGQTAGYRKHAEPYFAERNRASGAVHREKKRRKWLEEIKPYLSELTNWERCIEGHIKLQPKFGVRFGNDQEFSDAFELRRELTSKSTIWRVDSDFVSACPDEAAPNLDKRYAEVRRKFDQRVILGLFPPNSISLEEFKALKDQGMLSWQGQLWSVLIHEERFGLTLSRGDLPDHGEGGTLSRVRHDSVYLWQVEGTNFYKIGVTTSGRGDKRIREAMKSAKVNGVLHELQAVSGNALELERQLLGFGRKAHVGNVDGQTEYRELTDAQVTEISRIIHKNALKE